MQIEIQLGKKGLTQKFLDGIKRRFENKKITNLKVSVLSSARKNGKKDVEKYGEEIKNFLGHKFTYRVLGFSIFLKKWRKERQ